MTLGELTREHLFERVLLRGLNREEVRGLVESNAGAVPSSSFIDTLYEHTEGNPLFVSEIIQSMAEEGYDFTGSSLQDIRIPEGVKEVIGRRLNRLSDQSNEVLSTAALIGREFRFEVLILLIKDTAKEVILDTLDETISFQLIEELAETSWEYRFVHALVQETLVDEFSLTRRVSMHARIGKALEEYYGKEADAHAAELFEQYDRAETLLVPDKLNHYGILAGEEALKSLALHDARSFFERVLEYKKMNL